MTTGFLISREIGAFIRKDPDAKLDYTLDWREWLDGDIVKTSTWELDPGLTMESATHDGMKTTIWLSGGDAGEHYKVTNHIITTDGREDERSFTVVVRER